MRMCWTIRITSFGSKSEQPYKSEKRSRKTCFQQWALTVFDCSFFFFPSGAGEGGLVLHILFETGAWQEEEVQSCGCRRPLLSAGRVAAGDGASSGRRECVWEWLVSRCSSSPTLALRHAKGGRAGGHRLRQMGQMLLIYPFLDSWPLLAQTSPLRQGGIESYCSHLLFFCLEIHA